MVKQRWI